VFDQVAARRDGAIIAEIYKERVMKRGYGSGAWVGPPPITRALLFEQPCARPRENDHDQTSCAHLLLHHHCVCNPDDDRGNTRLAQQLGPDGAPNPTASVVSEQKLLQQLPRIEGQIDQPNERERVLMQPPGGNGIISMKSYYTGSVRS